MLDAPESGEQIMILSDSDSTIPLVIQLVQIIVDLFKGLAWPVTIFLIIKIYQEEFRTLLKEKLTGIKAGGINIDFSGIEQTKLLSKNKPVEDAAKDILAQQLVNDQEKRVIRALIDEPQGRGLYSYQKTEYYREGLTSLTYKGMIKFENNKYFLTNLGQAVAKEYIHDLFNSQSS